MGSDASNPCTGVATSPSRTRVKYIPTLVTAVKHTQRLQTHRTPSSLKTQVSSSMPAFPLATSHPPSTTPSPVHRVVQGAECLWRAQPRQQPQRRLRQSQRVAHHELHGLGLAVWGRGIEEEEGGGQQKKRRLMGVGGEIRKWEGRVGSGMGRVCKALARVRARSRKHTCMCVVSV